MITAKKSVFAAAGGPAGAARAVEALRLRARPPLRSAGAAGFKTILE